MSSRDSLSTTSRQKCGRGKILGTTTCPRTVVEAKQVNAPCKILLLQQSIFLCQSNLNEIIGWL